MSDPSEALIHTNQSSPEAYFCFNPSLFISQPAKAPKIEEFNELFSEYENIEYRLKEFVAVCEKGHVQTEKSSVIYNQILKKSKEVNELYYELFGYEEEDESGETVQVEGLKEQLEKVFNELKK